LQRRLAIKNQTRALVAMHLPVDEKDNKPSDLSLGSPSATKMSPAGTKERNIVHSFTSCLMHCVWAAKERRPLIKPDLQQRLWPYLGGIARENKMKALAIDGVEDHVHVLLSIPATLSVAKSIQLLKGNSSKWIHDTFKQHWDFEWQLSQR